MGYRTESMAVSLLDGMPPETKGTNLDWQRLGHIQLSLRAFLLAWSRSTPVDCRQQSNSTALALLLGIFLDDSLQDKFSEFDEHAPKVNRGQDTLWQRMVAVYRFWAKKKGPPPEENLGHTTRFEQVMGRIAYDAKRRLPWKSEFGSE
jgi:hypothetical protein